MFADTFETAFTSSPASLRQTWIHELQLAIRTEPHRRRIRRSQLPIASRISTRIKSSTRASPADPSPSKECGAHRHEEDTPVVQSLRQFHSSPRARLRTEAHCGRAGACSSSSPIRNSDLRWSLSELSSGPICGRTAL